MSKFLESLFEFFYEFFISAIDDAFEFGNRIDDDCDVVLLLFEFSLFFFYFSFEFSLKAQSSCRRVFDFSEKNQIIVGMNLKLG